MKKLLVILFLSFIPLMTFGENSVKNEVKGIANQTQALASVGADGGLSLISFGFCNEGMENLTKSINAAVEQGKPFEVCMIWQNNSNEDLTLTVDVPYATYTDQGDKTCGKDLTFKDFTQGLEEINQTTLPAGNYLIKKFNVIFPIGLEGQQEGCIVYNVEPKGLKEGQSGLIPRIRKGFFMNFFVGKAGDIKNKTKIKNIKTHLDPNKELMLSFDVENAGNVENNIYITGSITNILGFKKNFELSGGIVVPGKSLELKVNLGPVPSYGGLFNIKFITNTTPHFIYDISQSNIDPSIIEEKQITTKTTFFQMPRLIIGILILIILLLILAFRKPKQKIVYVEKPTTK